MICHDCKLECWPLSTNIHCLHKGRFGKSPDFFVDFFLKPSLTQIHEYTNHDSSVNSVQWAPHDFGLVGKVSSALDHIQPYKGAILFHSSTMRQVLACGSSDGAISVLCYGSNNQWEAEKINNAHTIGIKIVHSFTTPAPVVFEEL